MPDMTDNPQPEAELLPCPFCGERLVFKAASDECPDAWFHPGAITDGDCLLSGQGFFAKHFIAWNTRTPSPDPEAAGVTDRDVLCRLIEANAPRRDWFTDIPIGGQVEALADLILRTAQNTGRDAVLREVQLASLVREMACVLLENGGDVVPALKEASERALEALSNPPVAAVADPLIEGLRARIDSVVEFQGYGCWRTCSGCYESEDGYPNGDYPHSRVLGCTLGSGCSECGGIGAVWDNTDWEEAARWMLANDAAPPTTPAEGDER